MAHEIIFLGGKNDKAITICSTFEITLNSLLFMIFIPVKLYARSDSNSSRKFIIICVTIPFIWKHTNQIDIYTIHTATFIHKCEFITKKITLDEMCLQTQIIQTFLADLFVPFELFIESETVYNTYTAGAIAMHKFKQTVFGIIAECVAHTHTTIIYEYAARQ